MDALLKSYLDEYAALDAKRTLHRVSDEMLQLITKVADHKNVSSDVRRAFWSLSTAIHCGNPYPVFDTDLSEDDWDAELHALRACGVSRFVFYPGHRNRHRIICERNKALRARGCRAIGTIEVHPYDPDYTRPECNKGLGILFELC